MNFITSGSAYCLYPFSTVCRRCTLVCGAISSPAASAVKKYESRGWSPIYAYNADELSSEETPSEFKMNSRRVGDSFCWVQYRMNSDVFLRLGEDIHWHIKFEKDDETGFYYALALQYE
jgi:hypothetical protein